MPTNECLCYWWAAYWLPTSQLLHLLLTVSVPQQLERMTFSTTVKTKSLFFPQIPKDHNERKISVIFINTFATNISRLLDKALQQGRLKKLQLSQVPSLPSTKPRQTQVSHFRLYSTNIFTDAKSLSVRNLTEGDLAFAYTPYPIQQHFLLLWRSEFKARDVWHRITLLATEDDKRYMRTSLRPEGKNGL